MYIYLLCILVCLCVPYIVRNHKSADINFLLYHLIYFFKLSLVSCSLLLNPSKTQKKIDQITHECFPAIPKSMYSFTSGLCLPQGCIELN